MTKEFGMDDASFYAGILIASYSISEAAFSMFWGMLVNNESVFEARQHLTKFQTGGLSDRIGRKPILLFGCFGTMLSLLMVGFSTSFTMALVARVIGGALNGNIGKAFLAPSDQAS